MVFIIIKPKTKAIAFLATESVTTQIVVHGGLIEQVKQFNYLGCKINIDLTAVVDNKINKINYDTGISKICKKLKFGYI